MAPTRELSKQVEKGFQESAPSGEVLSTYLRQGRISRCLVLVPTRELSKKVEKGLLLARDEGGFLSVWLWLLQEKFQSKMRRKSRSLLPIARCSQLIRGSVSCS